MRTKLKPGEKIILKSHKHWFLILSPFIWTLIFFGLASISPFFAIVGILFFIVALYRILDRRTNIWVVTNLRIIDEQGIFSISTKETPLDKVNNVSYQKSFLGRIFDYGNITIQSAAERGATVHKMIENPRVLRDTITAQQEIYKKTQIENQASEFAKSIGIKSESKSVADELGKLSKLFKEGILTEEEFQIQKKKLLNNP